MKTNIKLQVTPEQSIAVQNICFANGVFWYAGNGSEVRYTKAKYLFIDSDRVWFRVITDHNIGPETEGYTEVDADLFIRTNGTCIESTEECQFAKYGFEKPDFECTILAKVKNEFIGYILAQNIIIATTWSKDGIAYLGSKRNREYDLTPINKPWYETCKFPALVWDEDNDLLVIRTRGEYTASYLNECKPLTNVQIAELKQ